MAGGSGASRPGGPESPTNPRRPPANNLIWRPPAAKPTFSIRPASPRRVPDAPGAPAGPPHTGSGPGSRASAGKCTKSGAENVRNQALIVESRPLSGQIVILRFPPGPPAGGPGALQPPGGLIQPPGALYSPPGAGLAWAGPGRGAGPGGGWNLSKCKGPGPGEPLGPTGKAALHTPSGGAMGTRKSNTRGGPSYPHPPGGGSGKCNT